MQRVKIWFLGGELRCLTAKNFNKVLKKYISEHLEGDTFVQGYAYAQKSLKKIPKDFT